MNCLMHERLDWIDEGCEVRFEGNIDIGSSNGSKTISSVCDEEWTTYVGVVIKSEIYRIELVVKIIARNDVCDKSLWSPTLPEVVDEQHIVSSCLLNFRKKLRTTLQRSPHLLQVMKQ
jgi:hypothetical protein